MTSRVSRATSTERLRASPSFAQAFSLDGRPYVAKETEPYVQYWLTERYRALLSMFGGRRGATEREAVEGYLRLTRAPRTATERAADEGRRRHARRGRAHRSARRRLALHRAHGG